MHPTPCPGWAPATSAQLPASAGVWPSQAQPLWLYLVEPPELRNMVFGGAGKKKGKNFRKNLVMLKETNYFKRLPPLHQLLTCSWALALQAASGRVSCEQGTVQAGHAWQRLSRGWYIPDEGPQGIRQPAEEHREAEGGMRVLVPTWPHSRLPSAP